MTNQTFIALVGFIILLLMSAVLMDKYSDCQAAAKSFGECFQRQGRLLAVRAPQ